MTVEWHWLEWTQTLCTWWMTLLSPSASLLTIAVRKRVSHQIYGAINSFSTRSFSIKFRLMLRSGNKMRTGAQRVLRWLIGTRKEAKQMTLLNAFRARTSLKQMTLLNKIWTRTASGATTWNPRRHYSHKLDALIRWQTARACPVSFGGKWRALTRTTKWGRSMPEIGAQCVIWSAGLSIKTT